MTGTFSVKIRFGSLSSYEKPFFKDLINNERK